MKSVRPGPPPDSGLDLTPEEGAVLSRIDRHRTVQEIAEMSGIPEHRVHNIVDALVRRGAVQSVVQDEPPSRAALPSADDSGAYTYQPLGDPVAEDEPSGDLFPPNAIPPETFGYPEEVPLTPSYSVGAMEEEAPRVVALEEEFGQLPNPDSFVYQFPEDSQYAPASIHPSAHPDEPAWGEHLAEEAPMNMADVGLGDSTALSLEEAQHFAAAFAGGSPIIPEPATTQRDLGDGENEDAPEPASQEPDELLELEELTGEDEAEGDLEEAATSDEQPIAHTKDEAEEELRKNDERNYRRIYEAKFHKLTLEGRLAIASRVSGADLCALCLDADAKVIAAIMANTGFNLDHARLVAFHHHTGTGLDMIAARMEFSRDGLVFRRLIRNTQLSAATLRKLLHPKRLLEIYKVSIDHDIPEIARTTSRGTLRTKFSTKSQPEDRAELIVNTDARCLTQLAGCGIDGRTTQILCGRQVYSALFVQNVARFGASPPALLGHLAKLPFVRRNPGLKKILMQHPNMPGDIKRSM